MINTFSTLDVTQPKDGYIVYLNYYWLCENGNPTKAVFYKHLYPQCNKDKRILNDLAISAMIQLSVDIVLIPIAYVKLVG